MQRTHVHTARLLVLLGVLFLFEPGIAAAATDEPPVIGPQVLPAQQLLMVVVGALSPLAGYLLNRAGPQLSQPVKAAVQVGVAALAGALVQLIDAGTIGLDWPTVELVGTAVVTALLAHAGLYRPAGISTRLGGYTPAGGQPPDTL